MSKPKYTGIERRCQHTGSSCIHRSFPPQQAYRVGPEPVNRADIVEIVAGSLIFLTLFLGIPFIVWLVAA